MLYKSELKKIFGNRFFTVVIVILLIVNGILAYREAPDAGKIPAEDIRDFVEYYLEHPDEIKQYQKDRAAAKNNFFDSEEYLEGVELADAVPDVYSKSDSYNDDDLLNALNNPDAAYPITRADLEKCAARMIALAWRLGGQR